ncbi:hypothetical protein B0T21DRAFT_191364 [Apiosordaria backusii]|uniref:Uncharacterized protein n=1 Tax=Apiosordaria backusii TaxID=314023 RepID=A0AA40BK74_9PEZI|nr:hypothetical protein B0T21DRAFT_191364 [Apiosordaria backusii]
MTRGELFDFHFDVNILLFLVGMEWKWASSMGWAGWTWQGGFLQISVGNLMILSFFCKDLYSYFVAFFSSLLCFILNSGGTYIRYPILYANKIPIDYGIQRASNSGFNFQKAIL